ncbi:MAG TPA: hypothetical protein VMG10_12085 [Gemmataceae bacterium]|nr:hypothetical protein [Gemmataceae bacterium]
MLDRHSWNSYYRVDRCSPWIWAANGATYGEANGAAAVRFPGAERTVIFGRAMPGPDGRPMPVRRRA